MSAPKVSGPPILTERTPGRGLSHQRSQTQFEKGVTLTETDKTSNENGTTDLRALSPAPVPALRHPATVAPPNRKVWLWISASVVALLLAALAYSQLWMAGPSVVAVERVRAAPVTRLLAVNGRIAAVNSVDIRPVVSGTLIAIAVSEGDEVVADQILAQVDAAAQNAIVRQAMAGLDVALVTQAQATESYERALSLGVDCH